MQPQDTRPDPAAPLFISPFTDYGFYHLFGKEGKSRQNLIFLLNAILHDYLGFETIVDVTFGQTENKGVNPDHKSTRYDIHCTTSTGHEIIVEMQNRWETNFDNRLLYYVAEAIDKQGVHNFMKELWNYDIVPVVGIAMCNFTLPRYKDRPVAYYNMREVATNEKYGDQINIVYVNIKEFTEDEDKCKTELEKIIYSLNNMETMQKTQHNPFSKVKGDFYDNLLTMSQYASLTPDEQWEYKRARMHANDEMLRLQRSHEQGLAKGLAEGEARRNREIAVTAKQMGLSVEDIIKLSGLSRQEIENL